MNMAQNWCKFVDRLSRYGHRASGWICLILVIVTAEQVVARYLFSAGSIAMQELQWHALGLVIFLSSSLVWQQDQHVRVDILHSRWSTRTRAWIDIFGILCFALPVCGVLIVTGCHYAARAYAFANTSLPDAWCRDWFAVDSFWYQTLAPVESLARSTVLAGETSADAGGLPGRWLIKAAIPLGGAMLFLQSMVELYRRIRIVSLPGAEVHPRQVQP